MIKFSVITIASLVLFIGCKSFTKFPAIPKEKVSVQEELKFIYKSGQRDQRRMLFRFVFVPRDKKLNHKKFIAFWERNETRINRVSLIIDSIEPHDYQSKYYAADVYIHGGKRINSQVEDSVAMKKSYLLYKDIYENANKKKDSKFKMEEAYRRWLISIKSN